MSVSQFHNKSNEDTQHPSFQLKEETVATDPESSESELTVEPSGEAVASKGKALRKAAAKRAARRQSAAEKPKARGGGGVKRNWHHFWKNYIVFIYCIYWFLTLLCFYFHIR